MMFTASTFFEKLIHWDGKFLLLLLKSDSARYQILTVKILTNQKKRLRILILLKSFLLFPLYLAFKDDEYHHLAQKDENEQRHRKNGQFF